MSYDELTLEQIEYINNTDIICDGDKKEVTLIERSTEVE